MVQKFIPVHEGCLFWSFWYVFCRSLKGECYVEKCNHLVNCELGGNLVENEQGLQGLSLTRLMIPKSSRPSAIWSNSLLLGLYCVGRQFYNVWNVVYTHLVHWSSKPTVYMISLLSAFSSCRSCSSLVVDFSCMEKYNEYTHVLPPTGVGNIQFHLK